LNLNSSVEQEPETSLNVY